MLSSGVMTSLEGTEMDEERIHDGTPEPRAQRSLTSDIALAVTGGAAGGAAGAVVTGVVNSITNRPPKEEPPEIALPPGVEKD